MINNKLCYFRAR